MKPVRTLRRRLRARRDEDGAILILVLIFLTVFSLIVGALLSNLNVNLSATSVNQDQSQLQYAADAGIEWGVNQLSQSGAECNSGTSVTGTPFFPVGGTTGTAPFTPASSDTGQNVNVTVDCMPVTGVGSGTFGGYSVVTGMNYPNVPNYPTYNSNYQSEEYAGTQNCISLSADPIGSGSPTYATQVTGTSNNPPPCLTYPTSSGSPVWNDSSYTPLAGAVSVTPGMVEQAFAVNNNAIYGVGAHPTAPAADMNKEGIYSFDSDGFTYIGGATNANTTLNGVWTPSNDPNHVWTVGDSGTILYCSANCTTGSPTWATQTSGTSNALNAITGTDATHLWAAGAGTLLFGNGTTWTNVFPSVTTGTASVTNSNMPAGNSSKITSATLFTGTANYMGWTVTGSPAIAGGTTITSETNSSNFAVMSHAATANYNGPVTLTPPTQPTFNDVWVDSSGDVWAVGALGANAVVYECSTTCSSYTNWIPVTGFPAPAGNSFSSITGSGSSIWAVGGATMDVCSATCTTGSNWSKVTSTTLNGDTLNSIVAADATDVWAVGAGAGGGSPSVIINCTSACATAGATWSTQLVDDTETTLNSVTAVPSGIRSDPTTWDGSVWTAGLIPSGAPGPGATLGTGWAVFSPLNGTGATLLDLKGGNVLNGGSLNAVTPMTLEGGNFVQYASGSCPSQPSANSLKIINGTWQCAQTVPAAFKSVDEPLPSETSGATPGLAACVAKATCTDMSALNVTVHPPSPYSTSCPSFTELFPGYYKSQPSLVTNSGATDYFASGVYYFAGGGWGAIDSGQTASAADGTTNGTVSISVPKSDNVFNNTVGFAVTDSANAIPSNATIKSVVTVGNVTTATISVAATASVSGTDVFTVANPAFVIGGQPGPADSTIVASNSPCWSYISSHGQQLDSPTGFTSLGKICGTGTTQCAYPNNSWYEGSGATATPNGTGVDWILGGSSWLDVHTVDLELFTRTVPWSTVTGASASNIAAQVANEGTEFVSMREVPPLCPASVVTQTPGFTDGALHPGPFCVLVSSKWSPLNPGANNQALQIDANNHDPEVYIHGSIYMPDNDMTLYTNQPQRDVWIGALDVNSAELTFDSNKSPPIQIISGSSPQTVAMEFIAQAQDANSKTTLWEEAVVNENPTQPPAAPTPPQVISWRVCNGPPSLPLSATSFVAACQT